MTVAHALAFVAFVLAGLAAMGWLLAASVPHAVALVALGLALEVLAGLPTPPLSR